MKKGLREAIINKRNNLSEDEILAKSMLIFKKLKQMDYYKNATRIMLYISFNNEVLTDIIIEDIIQSGKQVFMPVTVPRTKDIIVSELINKNDDLEIGTFGVLEPKKDKLRPHPPHDLDLVIVPGVAFDSRGYRIGYGAGYYDRFLPNVPTFVPKVSLAFDLQLINRVPKDDYDIPVEHIITESQYINCVDNLKENC